MTLSTPPGAPGLNETVKVRLREVADDAGRERITVEWRGRPRSLDVITMPVQVLYYNPDTHRVRAQRTVDPDRERELLADPWSDRSQEYLHELLKGDPSDPAREDPDFRALLEDLSEHGQNDPGIITPDGVLVNGNTRRAALRELGQPHIRVGVLPSDWSWTDVSAVELVLQLRKEYRREYSFINFLLTIDEQVAAGRTPADICREFRIKQPTFQRARWLLSFVNDAIDRSRTEDGTALRLVDFERHQGKLEELYRAVNGLAAKDPDAADVLKETRLAALVLGFSKTDLRIVEPDFYQRYLEPKLGDLAGSRPADTASVVGVPGLSVSVPDSSSEVKRVRSVTTALLRAQALAATDTVTPAATEAVAVVTNAKATVESALDTAGRSLRLRKRQLAAPERINDAADTIEASVQELVEARAGGALDTEAFDEALGALRRALVRLARQAARSADDPGPGVAWLIHATSGTDD